MSGAAVSDAHSRRVAPPSRRRLRRIPLDGVGSTVIVERGVEEDPFP